METVAADTDRAWFDAIRDAVAGAADAHGLDPDELLDVELDGDGEPTGAGVDFLERLESLVDADPTDETFAQAVADQVASYAAEIQAEPVAAAGYTASKHPHKGTGPGGGQFAPTYTPAPRGQLSYSGHQQGSGKYGGGAKAPTPATTYNPPNATLRKGASNDPAAVMQLQHMVNELGLAGINPDGNFGDSTEAAVKAVQAKLGMKPTGSATPALMRRLHDAHTLSPCIDRSTSKVAASYVEAAAGHDVTPGHDELHHWWVWGPGAARWVESPRPWTTLLANLVEEVKGEPLETLKRWASAWFLERFGFAAGSDLNRVTHGHPPRGHRVGPG